ncbi:endoplasmic reticulum protein [Irpex rosettiformis]|uniref:Endoplasmic reticulum protein n=1 Tax=Irpex rosettiformis TaxID=378272 RepID=A0ACB8TUT0_9APHY|nr:endoplasmic reticulum protein [Irpex rosettiformis]
MLQLAARRCFRTVRPVSSRMTVLPLPRAVLAGARQLSTSNVWLNRATGAEGSLPEKPTNAVEQLKDWSAKELTYEEVKPRTEQPTENAYLVDVREPDEVLQGSIPSSVNLPLSVLANSLTLKPETFKSKFGWEKPQKDQEIVFYCRSGKRAASACDIAYRNGFSNVLNYKGSWLDWAARENEKKST